ncbi:uncharacterized protein LOC144040012 isoform X2 [Vanacampus margaritifer]
MDELLDELLDRSPSSLVSEEPPAFPSVWRSSRLCAHSFFHNKHGLAHGRLFGSPIFHEQKHRPRQDVCAELHFLPRRVEVSRPSERRADGRRLLSALWVIVNALQLNRGRRRALRHLHGRAGRRRRRPEDVQKGAREARDALLGYETLDGKEIRMVLEENRWGAKKQLEDARVMISGACAYWPRKSTSHHFVWMSAFVTS